MRKLPIQRIVSALLRCVAITLACLASTQAGAIETMEAIDQIQTEAYRAFAGERFDALNAMADDFNATRARLPDGRWKLTFVISGLTAGIAARDTQAWRTRLQLAEKWIARTPNNGTPHVAKAAILIAYAWDARGSGYASAVDEKDWPVFRQRIAQARDALEKSAALSKRSPLWYEQMQIIATAQAWPEEEFLALFREGVEQEPTYYFLYFNAASYLLPRWHGSKSKLATFVNDAVKVTEQKEGQTLYARIYWSLLWALQERTFAPGYASWPRMRKGFDDIVRVYPDNWNLNAYTYYACMARDWSTAKAMAAKLASIELRIWTTPHAYEACMRRGA